MPNHHRAMIRREEHFYARFRRKPVKVEPPGPQFGSGWFDPTERVDIRLAVLRVNIGDGLHVRPDSLPTARAAGIGEDGECRVPGVVAHFHTALMITTPSAMASTGFHHSPTVALRNAWMARSRTLTGSSGCITAS